MTLSPTALRSPIETPDRLIGREAQLQMLAAALAAPQGGLYVILGGPGCGKTSLLRSLQTLLLHRLSGATLAAPWANLGPILPVWVTPGLAASTAELLRGVVWAFRGVAREQLGICQVDEDQLKLQLDAYARSGDLSYLDRGFREVFQVVEGSRRGLRLALLIDDIESIQARDWQPSLLASLYELLNPYTPGNRSQEWTLICSGGPRLHDLLESADSSWKSAGWNPISLTAWDGAQMEQAAGQIGLPAGWLPADQLRALAYESGGHPYLFQAELLPGLLAAAEMDLTGEALQPVLDEQLRRLRDADFWARWLDQLSEQARILFRALIPRPQSLELKDVMQVLAGPLGRTRAEIVQASPVLAKDPLATQRALKALSYCGLIVEREGRFQPGPNLWTRWFEANAPLPLAELFDRYKQGLAILLARLGPGHARYQDALVYQQRLSENIERTQRHGDNENWRSERSLLIEELNALAQSTLECSFNSLVDLK